MPAALDAGAACELINNGIHVHPAVPAAVRRARHRVILMTDAIDATGMGMGSTSWEVRGSCSGRSGAARGRRALAGKPLTMDEALNLAVVEVGIPIVAASAAASGNAARLLEIANQCGAIAPGLDADLVWLDEDYRLRRVMAQGQWISG